MTTAMIRGLLVVLAAVVAVGPGAAAAQTVAPDSLRVEWRPRTDPWLRPALEGHVHNTTRYRIGSVRLLVQVLDERQQVVEQRTAWVYGNVPAGDRGYFTVQLLPADRDRTFRISVESFVLIAMESP